MKWFVFLGVACLTLIACNKKTNSSVQSTEPRHGEIESFEIESDPTRQVETSFLNEETFVFHPLDTLFGIYSPYESLQHEDTLLRIQKGGCYGICEIYDVIIFESGRILLNGKGNVPHIGRHIGKIDIEDVGLLNEYADKLEFNTYRPHYPSKGREMTEFPMVTMQTREIHISYRHDEPKEVYELVSLGERLVLEQTMIRK